MTYLALALLLLTASAQAPPTSALLASVPEERHSTDLTAGGLRWSYTPRSSFGGGFLADRGGLVFMRELENDTVLLSSFDANPPAPIWRIEDADTITTCATASESDVFLFAAVREDPPFKSISNLKQYRSRSTAPEWRYTFPEQKLSRPFPVVSRDGRTIVSAFPDEASSTTVLRVHDPDTGEPIRTIVHPVYILIPAIDLSPDGSVVALGSHPNVDVYEVATGRHLFSRPGSIAGDQALSDGGRRLVMRAPISSLPENHVYVLTRVEDGYELTLDVITPSNVYSEDLVLSEDGSTLAGGWQGYGGPMRAIVRAFGVESGAMTMEHIDVAPSGLIGVGDISISADGSLFVASLYGDGSGVAPELALYSKHSGQPLAAYPNGGTVFSVQMSPDGKRYLANRAPTNVGYDYTLTELYEVGGEDLVVRGAPRIGSTITFELHGAPGSRAALLRSFALAPEPIVFPRIGTLHLDPATLSSTPMGIVPPSGVATYSTVASTVPGMIGRTLWFQGITSRPRHLTNDFVQLTILP